MSSKPTSVPAGTESRGDAGFQTTHWSMVLLAGREASPQSAEALEKLCQAYWYPLYAFARRQGCNPEEAQDATQEFFSRLLAKNQLQMADPTRGRFRSFLLASMKNMLANERRAAARQKRGGDVIVFSFQEQEAEQRYLLEPADSITPESVFERRWAETILARVLDRLEAESNGHALRFEQLKVFLIEAKGAAAFADMARQLGVTESALKSVVHRMRRRYAELFRDEVSQTVANMADLDDEMRHLLTVLSA
jgi:RNA polymerase sigma factor (sigma-70 family)